MIRFLCLTLILISMLPSRIYDLKFIPVFKSLVVKIERSSPARLALQDLNQDLSAQISLDVTSKPNNLMAGHHLIRGLPAALDQKIILAEMKLQVPSEHRDTSWYSELSAQQQARVRVAEKQSQAISATFADIIEEKASNSRQPEVETPSSVVGKRIVGPIEVTGGLAITNEHFLEVRRKQEGIVKEAGRVDLKTGTYELSVEDFSGVIEARLLSTAGHVLGEGRVVISHFSGLSNVLSGPKIEVSPNRNYGGSVASFYPSGKDDRSGSDALLTFFKGGNESRAGKDSKYALQNISRSSSTVVRASTKDHFQTSMIAVGGDDQNITLFPKSMIKAMNGILTGRNLSDSELSQLSVVWGVAELDGKAASGISIEVEGHPELLPIYFNSLLIPDPSLKETSSNGLFAFIDLNEDMYSLRANRGNSFFGYSNVVAELGSVAQAKIEYTAKKQAVPVRMYDAFSGLPVSGQVLIQGLAEELEVTNGVAVANLNPINRLGYIQYTSNNNDYISARYIYNDQDTYIHLPVISWQWLLGAKNYLRITEANQSGVVVGFVPDFDFDVYVAGPNQDPQMRIAYFDMTGKWSQDRSGKSGGGFAVFNLPADVHEIVVISKGSEKVFSKVIPVDANTLSVLNFTE